MSVAVAEKSPAVTAADLVKRAAALAPKLRERIGQGAELRRVPEATMADLVDSRILRACMPARFGGYELPFGAHTDVAMELARHCGSTGWVAGIIGSHNWWLGKYHPDAQREVWEGAPDALVGAAFASKPGTKAVKDGSDYILSGEWMWCSGIDNCDWTSLMTPVPQPSGPPDLVMVLLKKGEFAVRDVWNSPGMRATGSNNVVVENFRVPAHRVTRIHELNSPASPGQTLNTGWTFRLPMLDVFGYSVAGPTLGCAQGTYAAFIASMTGRTGLDASKVTDHATLQMRVAEAAAEIDAALALYRGDIAAMNEVAKSGGALSPLDIARIKRNCAYVATLAKRAAMRLVEATGAGGLMDGSPVYRAFADTLAAAGHRALNWDVNGTNFGKLQFGPGEGPDAELKRRQAAAAAALKQ
ncbi:MAG: acyl-CoA dehydrogenase family protein [Rhodospirillaceae bacterium]|nr:acyl-CoA dehydrogenase family protein [Rhodospirillaceae bacterium]